MKKFFSNNNDMGSQPHIDRSAIHYAVNCGNLEDVKQLLRINRQHVHAIAFERGPHYTKNNLSYSSENIYNVTPLHLSTNTEITRLLLAVGADPFAENSQNVNSWKKHMCIPDTIKVFLAANNDQFPIDFISAYETEKSTSNRIKKAHPMVIFSTEESFAEIGKLIEKGGLNPEELANEKALLLSAKEVFKVTEDSPQTIFENN